MNTNPGTSQAEAVASDIIYRQPGKEDGKLIWQLVKDTGVLDMNSVYCYLLQCVHHPQTCVVAELDGNVIGFVTAYLMPGDETTLFVWQVGTAAAARGRGVAKTMLQTLLQRPACRKVKHIHTTISPSNAASLALFDSLAKQLQANLNKRQYFSETLFPDSGHEQEDLIMIGPLH